MIKLSQLFDYRLLVLLNIINLSKTYIIISADDDKLCSATTTPTITLGSGSRSGLIITSNNSIKLNQHRTKWTNDFICNFHVSTSNANSGLFLVIQNLVFRKNEMTHECIDYVEYKTEDGSTSKRYCEQADVDFASDIHIHAMNLAPTINSFVEPSGVLDIHVFISKKPLKPYRKLELEIVLTSFRHCYRNSTREDQPCSTKYMAHCIYKGFINDGYVNCPYPGCVDEIRCPRKIYVEYKSPASLGVAISLFMVLLIVFAFFFCYVCRKRKRMCWAEGFRAARANCQCPQNVEMSESASQERSMPTAYTIRPSVATIASSVEDGGMPPSYDSLFPPRK